jgi:prepilin-type N-terminal cleavage/methylation domain-containing protein
MRTEKGFTLLELMVAAFLAALIAGLSLPRLQGLLRPDLERDVRGEIENLVAAVREEAILSRIPLVLLFDLRENTYRSAALGPDGFPDIFNDPVSITGTLPRGVRLADLSNPRQGVVSQGQFSLLVWPTGWVEPTTIHLVEDSGRAFTMFVEPLSGRVRLEEGYLVRKKSGG